MQLLLDHLQSRFRLDWNGIHGIRHWARVRANGLKLAKVTGADPHIVELFAFLHDSCRWNENHDPQHGGRAAELVRTLQGRFYHLSPDNLERLAEACAGHTHEATHHDITIATCWDADRLDLSRVDIDPDPARLCTEAARNLLRKKVKACE
jgi:uncharacterized protein